MKFSGVEALVAQIHADIAAARQLFAAAPTQSPDPSQPLNASESPNP
jgi:hypothetical protein